MDSKTNGFLNTFFELDKHNTNVKTEIVAGLTTFITMAYILIINPSILSDPFKIMGQMEYADKIANGVFIATCLGAFIGTMMVALYAKLPFAQAPGMGLNAFFAYTVVLTLGYTYSQALVIVFLSGILFIVITALGIREAIINAIPPAVKNAITPGIGLFITIIGLKNSGLIVANEATFISLVDFSAWRSPDANMELIMGAIVSLIGLCIMAVLHYKKVKGSIFLSIIAGTIIGIPLGVTKIQEFSFNLGTQVRDFAEISLFKLDFGGLIAPDNVFGSIITIALIVLSFSLVNMFDSLGTLLGAAKQSGLVDEKGDVIRMKEALMSDAVSTAAGALVGTSTVTTFVESSAGIAEGGRTGLTAFTTAIMFLVAIVFAPVVTLVPSPATAPALVFVGILMLSNVKEIDFEDMTNALPSFCTIVFMPFSYSIANGIALGLITFCIVKLFAGKKDEIQPLTLVVALIFALKYAFMSLG